MKKEIVRIVIFGFLANVLLFFGKIDTPFEALKKAGTMSVSYDYSDLQLYLFITGLLLAGVYTPVELAVFKMKYNEKNKIFTNLLAHHKKIYFDTIKRDLKEYNANFRTRIFLPKKGWKGFWNKKLKNTVVLELREIPGISDSFHQKGLEMEVRSDEVHGLVGKCYREETFYIDLDVNNNDGYFLTKAQKSKIGNLAFCAAIPIFSTNNSKIIAILSIDSEDKLDLDNSQKELFENHLIHFAAFVDKHVNL